MPAITISKDASGRVLVSGGTYPYREPLKAAGGRWDSAVRSWIVPESADLSFLMPRHTKPQTVQRKPQTVRRDVRGRCCSAAVPCFDDDNPQGPMIYRCAEHGAQKSSYCGT
jgi:hypothetical protein